VEQNTGNETETLQMGSPPVGEMSPKLTFNGSFAHNVFNCQFIMHLIPLNPNHDQSTSGKRMSLYTFTSSANIAAWVLRFWDGLSFCPCKASRFSFSDCSTTVVQ
jgi:hypothetical protein